MIISDEANTFLFIIKSLIYFITADRFNQFINKKPQRVIEELYKPRAEVDLTILCSGMDLAEVNSGTWSKYLSHSTQIHRTNVISSYFNLLDITQL